MGVDFYCGDKLFNCSYGSWHNIRLDIIKSTFDYIKDKFEKDKELYGNIEDEDDENWIGEGSQYENYMNELNEFMEECLNQKNDVLLDCFVEFSPINALYYFDLGGLFSFCNQSDCDGFYSPGNSLDICILFDKIKPFTSKYNLLQDCIYNEEFNQINHNNNCVYSIFEESYKNRENVIIS